MKKSEKNISFYLHKRFYIFPKSIEKEFKSYLYKKSIWISRMALILGIALYTLFSILDFCLVPNYKYTFWFIRFVIVIPILTITFILSFQKFFLKIMQPLMAISVLTAGFGIIAMIAILKEGNFSLYYYAGLILVLMWAYTFTRLSFKYSTIICWLIVIGYELIAVYYQKLLMTPELTLVFINNNFFFISANIMGMSVAYLIELSERRSFIQTQMISDKQDLLTEERNKLAEKNNKIKKEMDMAKIIQEQLIPKETPGEFISTLYKPMEEVGGDFYDFFYFKEQNKLGIFLSDVAGHGVPAALITSMIKSILAETRNLLADPAAILNHLNSILINQTQNYFVTVFYGIIDKNDCSMVFANGGHTNPYVCVNNEVSQIKPDEPLPPVGTFDNEILKAQNKLYKNKTVNLREKSKVIFYTDGLVEASKSLSNDSSFEDLIEDHIKKLQTKEPEDFVNSLYSELVLYKGNDSFEDDICIICLDTGFSCTEDEEPEELLSL